MAETRDLSHFVHHLEGGLAHIDLAVDGITCAGCMMAIEGGLAAVPNVTLARVNLTNRRVAVEWREGELDPACVIDRLAELGFRAYFRFAVGDRTGVPVLVNTSFNDNEPIVCRPEEALDCFLRTKMDVLVLGNFWIERELNARLSPNG